MKSMVVYDSVNGNTKQIAEAIGRGLGLRGDAKVYRPDVIDATAVRKVDLLVIGSPTYGGRPTEPVDRLLDRIIPSLPAGIRVAAFDTRLKTRFVKIFGFAADRIAARLEQSGAQVVATAGFFVRGRRGPLAEGEAERASSWGGELGR